MGFGSSAGADEFLGMSWIARVLPFIDQTPLWDQAIEDYNFNPVPFRAHRGMQTTVTTLGCPSDPAAGQVQWTHEGYLVACTNYLGVNGTNFQARDGLFNADQSIRLAEIADGQSNTLLIGERPPSLDFWYGWWYASGQGSISTGDVTLGVAELNPSSNGIQSYLEDCPAGPYRYGSGRNDQCDTLHFWSYHSAGGNFALADGSVRMIPYEIADSTMQSLATRNGGEVIASEF